MEEGVSRNAIYSKIDQIILKCQLLTKNLLAFSLKNLPVGKNTYGNRYLRHI
jgi:hypothetical protein